MKVYVKSATPTEIEIQDEKKRLVSGWASVVIVDKQGDIVPVSELTRSMLTLMDRGGYFIYGHSNKAVGKILQWDIREHPETKALGVHFIAKIYNDYPIDDIVWEKIKKGELKGFSIGATAREEKRLLKDDKTGMPKEVGVLHDLSLMEISIVDQPANPLALVDQVSFAKGTVESMEKIESSEDRAALERRTKAIEAMTKLKRQNAEIRKIIDRLKQDDEGEWEDEEDEEGEEEDEDEWDGEDWKMRLNKTKGEMLDAVVEVMKPFGNWENFDACVRDQKSKGYSEESAKRICGSLQAKLEKQSDDTDFNVTQQELFEISKKKRPPKAWWDKCVRRIKEGMPDYTDEQVAAVCGHLWFHRDSKIGD